MGRLGRAEFPPADLCWFFIVALLKSLLAEMEVDVAPEALLSYFNDRLWR